MSQLVRLEGKHSTQNAHCAVVHNIVAELPNSAITPEMYALPFWGKSRYNAKYTNRDGGNTASKTFYIAFTAAYTAYTAY